MQVFLFASLLNFLPFSLFSFFLSQLLQRKHFLIGSITYFILLHPLYNLNSLILRSSILISIHDVSDQAIIGVGRPFHVLDLSTHIFYLTLKHGLGVEHQVLDVNLYLFDDLFFGV